MILRCTHSCAESWRESFQLYQITDAPMSSDSFERQRPEILTDQFGGSFKREESRSKPLADVPGVASG